MGIRFLMALVVLTAALLVEYAFTKGGVLRWLVGATAPTESSPSQAAPPLPPPEVARREARRSTPPAPAAPPPAPTPTGTLPVTSSFEDDEAGWAYDAKGGDGLGARTMDAAYNGHFSLFSQASASANRGWPGWHTRAQFALDSGGTYVFRARAISPDGGNGWLDLHLLDASGTWLGGRSTGCSRERPGTQWDELELRYVNDDPRVASVRLGLLQCLNHSKGRATTIYFDDVRFEAAD
jgi:hypothetical protein